MLYADYKKVPFLYKLRPFINLLLFSGDLYFWVSLVFERVSPLNTVLVVIELSSRECFLERKCESSFFLPRLSSCLSLTSFSFVILYVVIMSLKSIGLRMLCTVG